MTKIHDAINGLIFTLRHAWKLRLHVARSRNRLLTLLDIERNLLSIIL